MSITITKKLTFLRAEKGWNRSEAARQCGIPISTYQAFEKCNRKPKGEAAIKIAKTFGVTTDYLLDDNNGYPPGPNGCANGNGRVHIPLGEATELLKEVLASATAQFAERLEIRAAKQ